MPHKYKTTKKVSSVSARPDCVRLMHGTTMTSAMSIVQNGISASEAKKLGSKGEFWATSEDFTAKHYATLPPSNGDGMIVAFDIPEKILNELVENGSALTHVLKLNYEFKAEAHEVVNRVITDIELTAIQNEC